MTKFAVVTKREKSLAENVVIIALLGLLMSSFIYYFFKQDKQITKVGFDNVASNFASRVTAIRAQWFMDGQPAIVSTKNNVTGVQHIRVNKKGWVDFGGEQLTCANIWQAVMDTELVFMKQPVVVLMLENNLKDRHVVCQYALPSGETFDYQMQTGKVSKVRLTAR